MGGGDPPRRKHLLADKLFIFAGRVLTPIDKPISAPDVSSEVDPGYIAVA